MEYLKGIDNQEELAIEFINSLGAIWKEGNKFHLVWDDEKSEEVKTRDELIKYLSAMNPTDCVEMVDYIEGIIERQTVDRLNFELYQKEYLKKEHEFDIAAYKLLKSGGAAFVRKNQKKAFEIAQNYHRLTYMLGDIEFRPNDKYLDVLVTDIHLALDVIGDN